MFDFNKSNTQLVQTNENMITEQMFCSISHGTLSTNEIIAYTHFKLQHKYICDVLLTENSQCCSSVVFSIIN